MTAKIIWKLPFIFEQLVLSPSLHTNKISKRGPSLCQLIRACLRLFRAGQLSDLYDESREVVSKSASHYRENPPPNSKSAQNAANDENFKSTCTRLIKNAPIVPINDINISIFCKLFPESLNLNLFRKEHITRSTTKKRKRIIFSPTEILEILSRLKQNKAPGLRVNSLDLFLKLARHCANEKGKKKNK